MSRNDTERRMKKINVNLSAEDLEQLQSGEEFYWNYDDVEVHLFQAEEEME